MTIKEQCSKTAAVCDKTVGTKDLQQLQKQVETLSEQVALLNAVDRKQAKCLKVRCFNCNRIGHTQNKCPEWSLSRQSQRCYSCCQIGHYARNCRQENGRGASGMVGPECIVVAAVKSEAATITGYVGGVATTIMLDSGSSVSLFQKDLLSKVSKLRRYGLFYNGNF